MVDIDLTDGESLANVIGHVAPQDLFKKLVEQKLMLEDPKGVILTPEGWAYLTALLLVGRNTLDAVADQMPDMTEDEKNEVKAPALLTLASVAYRAAAEAHFTKNGPHPMSIALGEFNNG